MSMQGVNNEEKSDLNKAESREIRRRSLRLLQELVRENASSLFPGVEIEATTLFQAASISKAVAAVAVLALVEHGDIDLDVEGDRAVVSIDGA